MPTSATPKIVLVTGASGFVGRALCDRLVADKQFVRALSRGGGKGPWQQHVTADLGAPEADLGAAVAGVQTVYHLAALTHDIHGYADEAAYQRINVDGTRRLIETAAAAGVERFVFLSSVKASGEGSVTVTDESTPPAPTTAYGRSKLAAESIVHCSGIQHTCALRSSLVYGPGVQGNIARMIRATNRGTFPPLPERHNKRSMVHVDDLVAALLAAADRDAARGRTYVVTDGRTYSTRNMYECILAALGKPPPRWYVPWAMLVAMARVGDVVGALARRPMPMDSAALEKLMGSAWFASRSAHVDLGFAPQHSLESAMPEMVRSLR